MMMSPMTGEQVHSPKIGSKKVYAFYFSAGFDLLGRDKRIFSTGCAGKLARLQQITF